MIPPPESQFTGGGIASGNATIDASTITGNFTPGRGGGIYGSGDKIRINESTISGNSSNIGGAVSIVRRRGNGFLYLSGATIANNMAIAVRDAPGVGGGVSGSVIISNNTIIAGNTDSTGDSPDIKASKSYAFNNLIGDRRGSDLSESPDRLADADGNLVGGPLGGAINPMVGPLADNGGPVLPGGYRLLTHALLAESAAIGAGDPTLVPGINGVPEFDERGAPFTRQAGNRIDIGAVEFQPASGSLSADFNLDGETTGADFLAWQRGLSKISGATVRQGDATADGDVDSNDLAVWKARFGPMTTEPGALATTAPLELADSTTTRAVAAQMAAAGVFFRSDPGSWRPSTRASLVDSPSSRKPTSFAIGLAMDRQIGDGELAKSLRDAAITERSRRAPWVDESLYSQTDDAGESLALDEAFGAW